MLTINILTKLYEIRGQKVMEDFDLAELYGVETKVLNQAVNRNTDRSPVDFMVQITRDEYNFLRSQIVTLEIGRGKYVICQSVIAICDNLPEEVKFSTATPFAYIEFF